MIDVDGMVKMIQYIGNYYFRLLKETAETRDRWYRWYQLSM